MQKHSPGDRPWPARYGVAVLLVAAALLLTVAIQPLRENSPHLLFFAAVILSLWYGQLGAGSLAIGLSVLSLVFFLLPPLYSLAVNVEQGVALGVFVLLALMIHSLQAHGNRLERMVQQTEEQFRLARKIQQKLFPRNPPRLPGLDVAGACRPAAATGGDYYDFIPMAGGRLGIAVGDVTSHGFGPALLMAEMHAYVRTLALAHADVSEILTLTNRLVCEHTEDDQFVTVFLGCLDPHDYTLVYASAGQQGFLQDAAGKVTRLDSTGPPLGVNPNAMFPCAPVVLLEGDCFILLITDGVFEAKGPGGTLFGIEQAVNVVRANRDLPAERIVSILCQAVLDFSANGQQRDDVTAVVIKRRPDVVETPGVPVG